MAETRVRIPVAVLENALEIGRFRVLGRLGQALGQGPAEQQRAHISALTRRDACGEGSARTFRFSAARRLSSVGAGARPSRHHPGATYNLARETKERARWAVRRR